MRTLSCRELCLVTRSRLWRHWKEAKRVAEERDRLHGRLLRASDAPRRHHREQNWNSANRSHPGKSSQEEEEDLEEEEELGFLYFFLLTITTQFFLFFPTFLFFLLHGIRLEGRGPEGGGGGPSAGVIEASMAPQSRSMSITPGEKPASSNRRCSRSSALSSDDSTPLEVFSNRRFPVITRTQSAEFRRT